MARGGAWETTLPPANCTESFGLPGLACSAWPPAFRSTQRMQKGSGPVAIVECPDARSSQRSRLGVFTSMRIAQIAPLHEAVPPKLYGGTERVVSYLTEELVALGHQVTLFASGDSETSARLEPVWPKALRLDPGVRDTVAPHFLLLETVRQMADQFDVLHFHLDY